MFSYMTSTFSALVGSSVLAQLFVAMNRDTFEFAVKRSAPDISSAWLCCIQSHATVRCLADMQVIVISFTLIIGLMLGTFAFVLRVGAVRFND